MSNYAIFWQATLIPNQSNISVLIKLIEGHLRNIILMSKFNVPYGFWEDLFWQNTSLVLVTMLNFLLTKKNTFVLLTLVQIYQLV